MLCMLRHAFVFWTNISPRSSPNAAASWVECIAFDFFTWVSIRISASLSRNAQTADAQLPAYWR